MFKTLQNLPKSSIFHPAAHSPGQLAVLTLSNGHRTGYNVIFIILLPSAVRRRARLHHLTGSRLSPAPPGLEAGGSQDGEQRFSSIGLCPSAKPTGGRGVTLHGLPLYRSKKSRPEPGRLIKEGISDLCFRRLDHPEILHARREGRQAVGDDPGPGGNLDQRGGVAGVERHMVRQERLLYDQLADQVGIPAVGDHSARRQRQGGCAQPVVGSPALVEPDLWNGLRDSIKANSTLSCRVKAAGL